MPSLLEDLKLYVGFNESQAALVHAFGRAIAHHLPAVADELYAALHAHPAARASFTASEPQIAAHRQGLQAWLASAFAGPHDQTFLQSRMDIGRAHVRVGLPQHLLITGMNVLRRALRARLEALHAGDPDLRRRTGDALDRLLDLELAILVHSYREDAQQRSRQHERLAAIGQLAASVAHELRQPLSVMSTSIYLVRRAPAAPHLAHHAARIEAQLEVAAGIVADLLELTRDRPAVRRNTPLASLVEDALSRVTIPSGVTVARDFPSDTMVLTEPPLLVRALVNLFQNALLAVGSQGSVRVLAEQAPDGRLALTISDDGPGFAPDILGRAFEPLVTSHGGTGLGLPLVQRVCERHGGTAEVANAPAGGARITLRLPREGWLG